MVFATSVAASHGDCGQPASMGAAPSVSDCLYVLRASVNTATCTPQCICDTNGSGGLSAADALVCLRSVINGPAMHDCPCAPPAPGGPAINESCTVCHGDGRFFDVRTTHPGLATPLEIRSSINSVTINVNDTAETAILTVDFTVTGPKGEYLADLGAPSSTRPDRFAYLRFGLSELMPPAPSSGDADTWVSYTIGDRNPSNLVDYGDGTYTYVFGTNLYPLYIPTNRHRLLLMVSGDIAEQPKNLTYDFVPSQLPGPFLFPNSRDIVTTAACNECHNKLDSPLGSASFHGGSRYEAKACATCHTTTLGGGVAEFGPMVHNIHSSHDLGELGDFSEVTYPQDRRNCRKCHAGPDGSNWNTRPTMTACASCHSDVNFETGEGHKGGMQFSNANCSFCHTAEAITVKHLTTLSTPSNPDVPEGLVNFEYVIEEVTVNNDNQPVVTFHINKDGEPLDLSTYPPAGFSGGPSFLVAYSMAQDGLAAPIDYNQLGQAAGQPQSASIDSVKTGLTGTPSSYTVTLVNTPYPVGATLRAVALQGYFTQLRDPEDQYSVDTARYTTSVVRGVTGDPTRRRVVDSAKCLNCHDTLALHGGNRVNNEQVCVICHNPNLSSSGRTVDTTKTPQSQKDALAAAGYDPDDSLTWPERSMNLKNLVHGIHGAAMRDFEYEFVRNRQNGIYYNFAEITFPGILSDCETCHLSGTYSLNLASKALLVSTDVTSDGLDRTQSAVAAARASVPNPTDLVESIGAGTCAMCHDNDPAIAHMGQSGGVLGGWRAEALGD